MNSKYLAGQKQNLNTFIRESPPSSSEQKVHGFLFLKEFTSVCDLSANRGFWLQPLIPLSRRCSKFLLGTAIISIAI